MAWRASFGNYVYDQVNADRAYFSTINNVVDNTLANSPLDFAKQDLLLLIKKVITILKMQAI